MCQRFVLPCRRVPNSFPPPLFVNQWLTYYQTYLVRSGTCFNNILTCFIRIYVVTFWDLYAWASYWYNIRLLSMWNRWRYHKDEYYFEDEQPRDTLLTAAHMEVLKGSKIPKRSKKSVGLLLKKEGMELPAMAPEVCYYASAFFLTTDKIIYHRQTIISSWVSCILYLGHVYAHWHMQ
jgi:hypothetical protein